MTKAEFYAEVTSISDLIDFAYNYEFTDVIGDIKSDDDFDDWVWDSLEENRPSLYWYEIKDRLNDLSSPDGAWFKITGFLQYENVYEEDLEYYMNQIVDAGEQWGFWDDEDDDDDWLTADDDPIEDSNSGDVCWDVSVDLSVLIGVT